MKIFIKTRIFPILIIIFLSINVSLAQKQGQDRVDSLMNRLRKQSKQDTARVNVLTELAFELQNNDPNKGLDFAEQARELSVKLDYQVGIGKALLSKGVCCYTRSENAKALQYLFQALKTLQIAEDYQDVVTTYLNIGNIYFNESDLTRTLNYYNQALKVLEDIGDYSRCASVYGNIGNVYYVQSDYPKSLEYQFKCLKMAEKSGNLRVQGNALVGIGNIYSKLPDYPKSLDYYYRSLNIFEAMGNKKGIASAYGNIGIVYYRQSDFSKALDNFNKAKKYCEEIGDKRGCAITYTNIGNVYVDQKNYTKALENHIRSNELFEEINSKGGMASALGNIGQAYTQLGDYKQALYYYQKALTLNRSLGVKSGALYNLKGLGTLYLNMAIDTNANFPNEKLPRLKVGYREYLANAIHFSEMAVVMGKEVGELAPLVDAYNIISRSYQVMNDWKKAYQYSDSANILQDSLFSQDKQAKISEIEAKRISEMRQKEMELFALNIRHQRIAIAAISGGFVLMVFIALLIYRSLRIKKKNNMILEEKNILITDQKEKIELTQQMVQSDIDKAKEYVLSLLPVKIDDRNIRADWLFIPSSQLGGDAFGYYWVDKDHFVLYILDTCGHGIGCALHSISVLNMLRSSVQLNVHLNNPEEVITALNESFLMEDHSDLFFSMWYGVYHLDSGELKYVCAGHPFPLIINESLGIPSNGKPNIPIGWYTGFHYKSETVKITPGTRIYLFSDGVYELQKPDGNIMSLNEFYELLTTEDLNNHFSLPELVEKLRKIQGKDEFTDDLSIVKIEFK